MYRLRWLLSRQSALDRVSSHSPSCTPHFSFSFLFLFFQLAMQIVAASPRFVSRADVPASLIDAERAVLTEQANAAPIHVPGQAVKKAAKPKDAAQLAKMMDGKSVRGNTGQMRT